MSEGRRHATGQGCLPHISAAARALRSDEAGPTETGSGTSGWTIARRRGRAPRSRDARTSQRGDTHRRNAPRPALRAAPISRGLAQRATPTISAGRPGGPDDIRRKLELGRAFRRHAHFAEILPARCAARGALRLKCRLPCTRTCRGARGSGWTNLTGASRQPKPAQNGVHTDVHLVKVAKLEDLIRL